MLTPPPDSQTASQRGRNSVALPRASSVLPSHISLVRASLLNPIVTGKTSAEVTISRHLSAIWKSRPVLPTEGSTALIP
ncbi:hypothetical protein Pmani_029845 [Petrolisthes manimaculis]|uniref:Uncharacterized protein n=1 Tax=Petrolisthes manimaculis TaxID=1843537 RepID=A0AAE1TWK9_9EUCA|nr:hypothetical protein Pmani_029845 [Petrolisthes manimaculis]